MMAAFLLFFPCTFQFHIPLVKGPFSPLLKCPFLIRIQLLPLQEPPFPSWKIHFSLVTFHPFSSVRESAFHVLNLLFSAKSPFPRTIALISTLYWWNTTDSFFSKDHKDRKRQEFWRRRQYKLLQEREKTLGKLSSIFGRQFKYTIQQQQRRRLTKVESNNRVWCVTIVRGHRRVFHIHSLMLLSVMNVCRIHYVYPVYDV